MDDAHANSRSFPASAGRDGTPAILIDSHAHLDAVDFDRDRDSVISRAFEKGIQAILCPAELTDGRSLDITLELAAKHDNIFAAAGVHPHQAKRFTPECLIGIERLASQSRIVAVGEIGLDDYYDFCPKKDQMEAFRAQLRLAQKLELPVIIHSRLSGKDIISAIKNEHFTRGGVLHCFTEEWDVAREMMEHCFFVSFSGIVTYPSARSLRDSAAKVPMDRLLMETDSPYLVPVPLRGKEKRNEPSYLIETARLLAELKGISLDELRAATSSNFRSLFLFEKKGVQC